MMRRILVPVDFSKESHRALSWAADLASATSAGIELLHVVEPIETVSPTAEHAVYLESDRLDEQRRKAVGKRLREWAEPLRRRGLRVRSRAVIGVPFQEIVEAAKKARADAIVLSTQGRTGLVHVFLGSVAEKVVRTAPCPVVTVGPEKESRRRTKRTAGHSTSTRRSVRI